MHRSKKIKIGDVNPHLLCVLCGGYFVDATTIIECLHSFCKTCIIRYLESNKTCPSCDVLIHKTRPRLNIRSDKTLQDIVYKLVPGLYKNEMRRRREFYSQYPNKDDTNSPNEKRGDEMAERFIFTENEKISLALEYWMEGIPDGAGVKSVGKNTEVEKEEKVKRTDIRYLQCPGALTVSHLKKFIRLKFELPARCRIDIYHKKELLSDLYTLLDIACIFSWKRLEPLRLYYSIYENIVKKRKVEETITSKTMASAETQTKELADEGCSGPQKAKLSAASDEHKFLTPTATKDWNPSLNRISSTSSTKLHPKVNSPTSQRNPLPATPKSAEQQNQMPSSPRPLIQTTLTNVTAKLPAQNMTKMKTTSAKTTVVKPPKQNQKSTLKRLSYQPAKIAPKIQTTPSPNRLLNQHSEIKNQLTVQSPNTVKPAEKHGPVQTVRLLVNNKTVLNQVTSAAPVKVTQRPNLQQTAFHNTNKSVHTVTTEMTKSNTTVAQHGLVSVSAIPPLINTAAKASAYNHISNESVKNAQPVAAKEVENLATVSSVDSTPSNQITAKSSETLKTPVSGVTKQSKCVTPKTTVSNIGNGNGNGPLKVNLMDLSSVPEGAVIRSVRPNDSMMLSHLGSKSAITQSVKLSSQNNEKQSDNRSKTATASGSYNGKAVHPMPNVTGMPEPKTNGRPATPKSNSVSRPPTPHMNNISRPATPKVSNESRSNTPKSNGVSKSNAPKVNGSSRPATPVSVGSELNNLKPIAPKPILPKEDARVSPTTVNPDLRLSMAYSKVQADKRPIPTIDSSSSDICEEIRQRKLARMDEPLNLVKRDQEKKKSLSPVNGNVSPNVSPINNPLPMVVGSMGI